MSKLIEPDETDLEIQARNKIAVASLMLAKVAGLAGFGVAFAGYRAMGGALLLLDGLMIAFAIGIYVYNTKRLNKRDSSQKEMLEKMMHEGVLRSYLKEIGYHDRA